ncbi:MAG: condensation domain-containing protein, partial [Cyclobacteriaceae bacterium]
MPSTKIEGIFPLTFMQQILLVHSLYEAQDQGQLEIKCTLNGRLNAKLFEQAWQETIQLHPALRSSLHWENIEKPVQIVRPKAQMPWQHKDWCDLSASSQIKRLGELMKERQMEALEFSKAPVSRITLIKISNSRHILLWSCHHILLDGWSAAVVLKDVFAYYDALCKGHSYQPDTVPSYQSYLAWIRRQDIAAAETFWKNSLDGYKRPILIGPANTSSNGESAELENHVLVVSEEKTQQIQAYLRRKHVTLNTLVLALWGVLLGRLCDADDVVFGTTVSGRSGDFPNMERMAGLFMNVLPVRLKLVPKQPIGEWLKSVQTQQFAARDLEHISLGQITSWTNWPGHMPIFDSLVAVENYPWSNFAGGGVTVKEFEGGITTTYPVTMIVKP